MSRRTVFTRGVALIAKARRLAETEPFDTAAAQRLQRLLEREACVLEAFAVLQRAGVRFDD